MNSFLDVLCLLSFVVLLLNCVQLFAIPKDRVAWKATVHGIFQVRMLEWVAISSSRGSSWPRSWTCVSALASGFCYHSKPPGKPIVSIFWSNSCFSPYLNYVSRSKDHSFIFYKDVKKLMKEDIMINYIC